MKITSSKAKVTYDKISEASTRGLLIADAIDVVMDQEFIERSRHDWCWVGWKNVPAETGWYKINRNNKELTQISNVQAEKLEWHERLFVYGSGHAAVKENSPLALYIGDEYSDGRLSGLYLCGPDVFTWVAQK